MQNFLYLFIMYKVYHFIILKKREIYYKLLIKPKSQVLVFDPVTD